MTPAITIAAPAAVLVAAAAAGAIPLCHHNPLGTGDGHDQP